jgi:hypothetical protein
MATRWDEALSLRSLCSASSNFEKRYLSFSLIKDRVGKEVAPEAGRAILVMPVDTPGWIGAVDAL